MLILGCLVFLVYPMVQVKVCRISLACILLVQSLVQWPRKVKSCHHLSQLDDQVVNQSSEKSSASEWLRVFITMIDLSTTFLGMTDNPSADST